MDDATRRATTVPKPGWIDRLLHPPRRLLGLYPKVLRDSHGEPGLSCAICDGPVKPDQRICIECEAW